MTEIGEGPPRKNIFRKLIEIFTPKKNTGSEKPWYEALNESRKIDEAIQHNKDTEGKVWKDE